LSPIEQQIKEKIERLGTPLKDWNIQINYGIKTGYNEAFIISGEKRKELIEKDPKSDEIIRPILRGKDIKRYGYDFADRWLINTHNGIGEKCVKPILIDDYPAIKRHLDQYFHELEIRADQGDTPYNLRNCAYMEDFSEQKIVWARLMRISKNDSQIFPRFSIVPEDYFTLDSLCFIVGKNLKFLLSVLNSKLAAYYFFQNIAILDNGGMQMRQQYVENIPIPKGDQQIITQIETLVESASCNPNKEELEKNINEFVNSLYRFNDKEIEFVENYLKGKKAEISLLHINISE